MAWGDGGVFVAVLLVILHHTPSVRAANMCPYATPDHNGHTELCEFRFHGRSGSRWGGGSGAGSGSELTYTQYLQKSERVYADRPYADRKGGVASNVYSWDGLS